MTDALSTLGARLRGIIAFRRLSIASFAERATIPYRTLQNYLADKRKPAADHLVRLYRADIDVLWLLTGRCGAPLDDYLPLGELQTLAVFGERRFSDSLIWQAALAADEFHLRYHEKTGELLRRIEAEVVLSEYIAMYAARATELADVIEKMGATDFLLEDVVRVLATSPTEDMDERFYRRIELFKAQIPRGSASRMIALTDGGKALFRQLDPTPGLRIPARVDQSFRRKVVTDSDAE